jgi:predicted nucleic acid-binding protein
VSVVDASLGVKWFVEEPGSDLARKLLDDEKGSLRIPDIFVVETAATLVRIANQDKSSVELSRASLYLLIDLIDSRAVLLERTPPGQAIEAAYLAIDLGHPLKDCIYLALAMELGCELVTCDARFAAKAKGVWEQVRVLGEGTT